MQQIQSSRLGVSHLLITKRPKTESTLISDALTTNLPQREDYPLEQTANSESLALT
jgi:hypothetical protein